MPCQDEQAITKLLDVYRTGFLHHDADQLASIWIRRHEHLIYVAQELRAPLRGWAAIEQYYAAQSQHLESMQAMDLEAVSIDVMGETALALFWLPRFGKVQGARRQSKVFCGTSAVTSWRFA